MFDIVTAGVGFDDFVFHSLTTLPRAGQEVTTSHFMRAPGGGAVITAVAAARLGLKAAVVSGLSAEAAHVLRAERVAVRNLRHLHEPAALTVALSTRRDRRFITYAGMNGLVAGRIRAALRRIRTRHLHFAFAPPRCRPWKQVLAALRRRRITTSWDFGFHPPLRGDRGLLPLVCELDYLFLNRTEALLYSQRSNLSAAASFWRRAGCHVVIKLGAQGSRLVNGRLDLSSRAPRVRAVDTTGAGDAFNGGFLAARLRGHDIGTALRAGNQVGARSTRHAGGIAGLPPRGARS